jgi:predicted DNA-binding protein (MmcQ/YjbR family)
MPDVEFLRRICLHLPGTIEQVQWQIDLVFKVGGKMYAVAPLEPARVCLSFKCSPVDFAELTERPGIIPAPYLAPAQWVALEDEEAMTAREIRNYLRRAYEQVRAKLPKKVQAALAGR